MALSLHAERIKAYEGLAANDDGEKDTIEDALWTGGVIVGGTWEHRKRAKEMLSTADSALGLTVSARGSHLGNFLPKEELDKFLKNAEVCDVLLFPAFLFDCYCALQAKTTGQEIEQGSDFEKQKLDSSNLGFQMMIQAGWQAGQGLGANTEGIVNPVGMT